MDSQDNESTDPVSLANKLLRQCNSSKRVHTVADIGAAVLLDLYSGFLAENPEGLIAKPITQEDEVHNCQTIIDQLAVNLHTSLSHIRGRSVVEGDELVIKNLLEIIVMLADIILNKIDSDISVDFDDSKMSVATNDVTGELSSRQVRWESARDDSHVRAPVARPVSAELRNSERLRAPVSSARQAGDGNGQAPRELMGASSQKLFDKSTKLLNRANQLLTRSQDLSRPSYFSETHSPPPAAVKNNWLTSEGLDKTDDLVKEGEMIQKRLDDTSGPIHRPHTSTRDTAASYKAREFDHLGVRPKMTKESASPGEETSRDLSEGRVSRDHPPHHRTITHHLYHHYPSHLTRDFSASLPLPNRLHPETDRLRTTVGPVEHLERQAHSPSSKTKESKTSSEIDKPRILTAKGLASSYTDLHNLVSDTAAYVRAAVRRSPVRSTLERDALTDYRTSPTQNLTRTITAANRDVGITKVPAVEDRYLARDLNVVKDPVVRQPPATGVPPKRDTVERMSPEQASRKVSFMEKSAWSGSGEISDRSGGEDGMGAGSIRVSIQRKARPVSDRSSTHPSRAGEKFGSYTDLGYLSDTELDNGRRDDRVRTRYQKLFKEKGEKPTATRPSQSRAKQVTFQTTRTKQPSIIKPTSTSTKPRTRKQRGVLIDTRNHLLKENKTQKKRTQILKKMYEEDYEDLREEYKHQTSKVKRDTKDKENEFKKKVSKPNVPRRSDATIKVVPSKKARMTKPTVSTKVRRHSSGSHVARRAISVTDEEDLMPILLEEFPYLHLSENTWHELWRRGINQIDQLTRTYAETKRKKSLAQEQIEDAEKRHDLLTTLVKKQLEHSKRLEEIKDQRVQQASVKNKVHEKRIQSARARKYYNEYQVRMRSKMLKRRTREEMIFKKLFDECLAIQRDRIQEVRRYAKEQRANHVEQRSNEIASMENYYSDQFTMLAERVAKERDEMDVREKAQQKWPLALSVYFLEEDDVLTQMKRELRHRMEKEIKNFQEQIFRDEDETYFRQLDADRLKHGLQLARYQTKV